MRILFLGDGAWATDSLQQVIGLDGVEVAGLVLRKNPTDPDLEILARKNSIPVLQPDSIKSSDGLGLLSTLDYDLGVSVSYDQILDQKVLATAREGFINFHAGMLPFYRGRNVVNWALINGEDEIGLTSHFIDLGIDTGDIILQRSIIIDWTDTYATLLDKLVTAMPGMVTDTLDLFLKGQPPRTKQSHLSGSYCRKRGEGDEWIDWQAVSSAIYNKIRGITRPGPGARATLNGQDVIFWRADFRPDWVEEKADGGVPGQILACQDDGALIVKTKDAYIRLEEFEFAGENSHEKPTIKVGQRFDGEQRCLSRP